MIICFPYYLFEFANGSVNEQYTNYTPQFLFFNDKMSTWALRCSVCKKNYSSHFEWLNHLLGRMHQDLAVTESQKWDQRVKECVIVSYSTIPIARHSAHEILKKLSPEASGIFVTDFILWRDRPKVTFVQFESKEKVEAIIPSGSNSATIQLDSFRIQVKRAVDMIDFEWKEFFPDLCTNSVPNDRGTVVRMETKRRLTDNDPNEDIRQQSKPKRTRWNSTSLPETHADNHEFAKPAPVASPMSRAVSNLSLKVQYLVIKDEMAIPDIEFKKVENLLADLRSTASKKFPLANVYLFRHLYLQIKNCGTNQMLVFLDTVGIWGKSWKEDVENAFSSMNHSSIDEEDKMHRAAVALLATDKNIEELPSRSAKDAHVSKSPAVNEALSGTAFFHKRYDVSFHVVTSPRLILETQTCRLIKYLAKFDPRVVPLLSLINYWAKLNKVFLSEKLVTDYDLPFQGAEPMTLDWMVISFLCKQKIIPSTRTILEREHDVLLFRGDDIGFAEDAQFYKKWKTSRSQKPHVQDTDEFIISLFAMAHDFFTFYLRPGHKPCILNTKDGEWISEGDLLGGGRNRTKLTTRECSIAKSLIQLCKGMNKIQILHPLQISRTLSFNNRRFFEEVQPLFKQTAAKLSAFKQSNSLISDTVDLQTALICSR